MNLEERLVGVIAEEAQKLTLRHHEYHNALHLEHARKAARIAVVGTKEVRVPDVWMKDKKFNPFYVHKHRRQIARALARAIESGAYKPRPPEVKVVPKPAGGFRSVTVYQIPDQAVSRLTYEQLLIKNRHRFSSFAYAYRDDRNVHFAIQDIALELRQSPRVFVAEFDFSKFFDSINHNYLFAQFDKNGFSVSEEEQRIIGAFVGASGRGIPQGTSISLFLANMVCWRLDKGLEKAGLQFARYADDTVIWSPDYPKISKAFELISQFSSEAGVPINTNKSDGISLLCHPDMPSEFATRKDRIEFLGYSISAERVGMRERSIKKIKREISYKLYKHLIQPLSGPRLVALVIPSGGKDPALMSALQEVRRYLYGNLTEAMIRSYLNGRSSRIFFKGVMSHFPLIDDERQLRALDGWLVSTVYKCLRKRANLLAKWRFPRHTMFPFSVGRREIAEAFRLVPGKVLRIPSFVTMYKALKRGVTHVGVGGIVGPGGYGRP